MKDLAVRLAALDPDAGAALRVIAYFDRLAETRAGLQTIVRGAAVLAGCPARLVDEARRIQVRVQPDGSTATGAAATGAAATGAAAGIRAAADTGAVADSGTVTRAGAAAAIDTATAIGTTVGKLAGVGEIAPAGESRAGGAAPVGQGGAAGEADSSAGESDTAVVVPDPAWMSVDAGGATLWLERAGPPGPVEAMVLERAAAAAKAVLDRTRSHPPQADPALIELVIDAEADELDRLQAAARLGYKPTDRVRAVALEDGTAALHREPPRRAGAGPAASVLDREPDELLRHRAGAGPAASVLDREPDELLRHRAGAGPAASVLDREPDELLRHRAGAGPAASVLDREPDELLRHRAGIGPTGPVAALPESWAAARTALRFTAEGTERDPGRRVVHADDLGGLMLLAAAVGPGTEPVPDVLALDRATAPWMLTTLDAVAETASLRAAATVLRVHHSTLQDRLAHTIPVLGWDVREPRGRLRLQLALALRRLHRNNH